MWNDPAVRWTDYDLVLANGVWDNIRHVDDFVRWTEALERDGVRVANSPATLRWNLDKRYLRQLAAAGVPVVPTVWVEQASAFELEGEVVVKPTVSGGGHHTARYQPHEHDAAHRHVDDLLVSGRVAMIQPYQAGGRRGGRGRADLPGGHLQPRHAQGPDDPARRRPARRPHRQPGGGADHAGRRPARPWATERWRRPSRSSGRPPTPGSTRCAGPGASRCCSSSSCSTRCSSSAGSPTRSGGLARVLAGRIARSD